MIRFKAFENRPLCFGCTLAVGISFLLAYTDITVCVIFLPLSAALSAVFILLRKKTGADPAVACICLAAVCASFTVFYAVRAAVPQNVPVSVSGYTLPPERAYATEMKITKINGNPVDLTVISDIARGNGDFEEFSAEGVISAYEGEDAAYQKGNGVFFSFSADKAEFSGKTHKGFLYAANAVRNGAQTAIYRVSDNAGIISRVFLGIRDGTPDSFAADMKSLGVSHLLAVSGLHVTALLFGFERVLTKLFGKNRLKLIALCCAALFYTVLTGFTGSVIRASVMYLIFALSKAVKRRSDGATTLCLAVFLIIAVSPASVYDTGFLLSASATFGIVVLGAPLAEGIKGKFDKKLSFLSYICRGAVITLSALLATLPVAALTYGSLSYAAVFYNLIVALPVTVVLYVCPYMILLSRVPLVGRALGLLCDGLCSLTVNTVHFFAEHNVPSVSVRYPFVIPLICVFAALYLAFAVFTKKRRAFVALSLAFILIFSVLSAAFFMRTACSDIIIVSPGEDGDFVAAVSGGRCKIYDFTNGKRDGFYELADELLKIGVTRAELVLPGEANAARVQSYIRICGYFDITRIYVQSGREEMFRRFLKKDVFALDSADVAPNRLRLGSLVYCTGEYSAEPGVSTVVHGASSTAPSGAENEYFADNGENKGANTYSGASVFYAS